MGFSGPVLVVPPPVWLRIVGGTWLQLRPVLMFLVTTLKEEKPGLHLEIVFAV